MWELTDVLFLCPFDLNRAAGTPLRAKTTVRAAATRWECAAVATAPFDGVKTRVAADAWKSDPRTGSLRFRLARFARAAKAAIDAERPRVIHVFTGHAFPAAWWARNVGGVSSRLIAEIHGVSEFEMRENHPAPRVLFTLLERIAVGRADQVIAMSHTMREFLVGRYGVPADRVSVIWGPVELPPPRPMPEGTGTLEIGYAGNARFWQGLDTAVAACKSLRRRRDIRFHFAGFGPGDADLADCPNAEVLGRVSDEGLAQMLSACHVLLSTRIRDAVTHCQYPHKLSTYLAAGRAVIASDVSDQRRIIEEAACGRVVPSGDVRELVRAIEEMAEMSAEERARLGSNARAFAERHLDARRLPDRLAELYGLE